MVSSRHNFKKMSKIYTFMYIRNGRYCTWGNSKSSARLFAQHTQKYEMCASSLFKTNYTKNEQILKDKKNGVDE